MLHRAQLQVLESLLFLQEARFQELNIKQMPTDQFNFHIKQLRKLGYIKVENRLYSLTDIGKDFAGRIDTKSHKYTIQPKVGVCLFVFQEKDNETLILLGKRLKDQSKDLWGPFSEKIHAYEPIENTIVRCLTTETGLTPLSWDFAGVHRYMSSGVDVILQCFLVTHYSGQLLKVTAESENSWIPLSKIGEMNTFLGLTEILENIETSEKFFFEVTSPALDQTPAQDQ